MDETFAAFALLPLWARCLIAYLFAGLAVSLYRAQRDAGKGVAAAIAAVLWAAVSAPVTAALALYTAWRGTAAVLLAFCLCSVAGGGVTPGPCPDGKCPFCPFEYHEPAPQKDPFTADVQASAEVKAAMAPASRGHRPILRILRPRK